MAFKIDSIEPIINGIVAFFALKIVTDFIGLFFPYMAKLNIVYNIIIFALLVIFRKRIIEWLKNKNGKLSMPHDKYTSAICAKCENIIIYKNSKFECKGCTKEALINNE